MPASSIRFAVGLFIFGWLFASASQAADTRSAVLDAMKSELDRSVKRLQLDGFESPYFISYALKTHDTRTLTVRYESVFRANQQLDGELYVETRVGDYRFDNTGQFDGYFPFATEEGLPISEAAPIDGNLTALKNALWLLTDRSYKEALNQFQQKKGKAVYERPDTTTPSFSRETPARHFDTPLPFHFDDKAWATRLKAVSRQFATHPEILQHQLRLATEKQQRYFVSSEGARLVTERVLFSLTVDAEARAEDDMVLTDSVAFYAASEKELPAQAQLEAAVTELIAGLVALKNAPLLDPYSGPAILAPRATGVLIHEAVGHRLEGERLMSDDEGRTYKGQIGQRILPEFLDVLDDPTQARFGDTHLNGFYRFDDEGVPAQAVTLVEGGVLKNFLLSRAPIEGFVHSNGHGRASGTRKPMARMGNTFLFSHRCVPMEELKQRLIEMVKAQNKPYGLIIHNMEGGSTNTSSYGYQAFKGIPQLVWRVFPDGREELVRGVELVGTPIASINKIVLTSDTPEVFNGFCGAESGYVPVSAIAPAVLLSELELQRKKEDKARPPILPSPFNGETAKP